MGNGDAARFFGIVEEIRLYVFVGVIADNFDGILVGADRTVGAESVEFTGSGARGRRIEFFREIEGRVRDVLVNADGEMIFRLFCYRRSAPW